VNAAAYDSPDRIFRKFTDILKMAMEDRSNSDLLGLWKQGDQRAAQILVDRYMTRLTALARSRLSQKLSRRLDAEDVVLSAWRSFFVAVHHSRVHVPDDDNLWPLLVTLAMRKLQRQAQRHRAERRSIEQEISFDSADVWPEIVSQEPGPEHAIQLTHDIETLMARLDPADREILTRRLQGEELEAIAGKVNCSERSVRRAMQRVRLQLAEHFDLPTLSSGSISQQALPDRRGVSAPGSVAMRSPDVFTSAGKRKPPATESRIFSSSPGPSLCYEDLVLESLIGQGSFGRVYRAHLRKDGSLVAVKYLRKRFWNNTAAANALIEETRRALTIAHPHIIRHDGWGVAPSGAPFLTMEYVDGPDAEEWVREGAVDSAEIVTCGLQLSEALSVLHRAGILHGDIAPGNVLRRSPFDFVLTDFGLSQSVGEVSTTRGGTPGFLAPEQISSAFGTVSERTDIYSLAAFLYFLVTRRPPFIGRDVPDVLSQILSSRPPLPLPDNCGLPASLVQLIMTCLRKEPSQRIATMEAMMHAMHQ
jgi:eukaryotic-like serine/threonine-protein kinase